jgi:hypothetical protein
VRSIECAVLKLKAEGVRQKAKRVNNFMRCFLVGILLVVSLSGYSQAEKDSAEITFEKTFHDFGDIIEGDSVEYIFKFTNTGKDALEIDRIISSCSCTPAIGDTLPIPPGGTGEIKVGFKSQAGKHMGIINKQVSIFSNAKKDKSSKNPFQMLRIRLNVLPKK